MSWLRQMLRSICRRSLLEVGPSLARDFHEDLRSKLSCWQGSMPVNNVTMGRVRQPCRELASLPSVSAGSLPLPCSSSSCLRDALAMDELLESCNGSKPSDLQEINIFATLKMEEGFRTSASISGTDMREHQSIPLVAHNVCARDGVREASPLQQNRDMESRTGFLDSSKFVENMTTAGISQSQNGTHRAIKENILAHDDLRVVKRVKGTEYLEHDGESSIRSSESLLHLDDSCSLSNKIESPQDVKIVQDICNLLESKGWESSTEASLNKHFTRQLSHSIIAKIILKQKQISLVRPFFEWACRNFGYDMYSCHALLLKFGEKNLFDEMWELLIRMRDNNCQVDETTFCIMVKAYGAAGMPDMAVDVIRRSVDYGVTAGIRTFTTLLGAFFKLRLLGDARLCYNKLLVEDLKLDTHLFSTLIRGFGMMGYTRDAQTCFDVMLREGFEPDISTYNSLIEGFCCSNATQKALSTLSALQKKGLKPNVSTFNVLIKTFCRAGKLEDAIKLYQSMENVCWPNQATFNILLQGLLANAEASKAISFFQSMEREGWVDAKSYVFLSNGLREMRQTEEVLELLRGLFDAHGYSNIEVCNSLIYNLSHLDQLDQANGLFREMATALENPSVPTYAIMISAYCRAEKLKEASELLIELKAQGCKPSAFCYIPIILLMLKRDRVVDALKWVEEMLELSLEVSAVTFDLLLKKLCTQGMVDEALKMCDIIAEKRLMISVDTLFELLKCLCKLRDVEVANARFRALYKQQGLPKCKAVLQALAVMNKMAPICNEG